MIQVAIVRPGPIQGDMVHPYLRRREGKEPVDYPTPELRAVLEKTLGVPLFQEQAMRVAIVCAGFSPARPTSFAAPWRHSSSPATVSDFPRQADRRHGRARVYSRSSPSAPSRRSRASAATDFPKATPRRFALIAYASSWMKCHHPDVFCCALLNAQPMGFYAPAQIVRDARQHGVEVRPVCVNASRWDCTLEPADRSFLRRAPGLAHGEGPEQRPRC